MNTFSQVWVFSDTPSRLPELMNGAQALANQINTFVLNDADGNDGQHDEIRRVEQVAHAFPFQVALSRYPHGVSPS